MTVVDSSGWVEYFQDGPRAQAYERYLKRPDLLVPTIVLYEVYKLIRREASEEEALVAVARMKAAQAVPLDEALALEAADLSLAHRLPLADAVVYASVRAHQALLVTGDQHFRDLPGVEYLASE